MSLLYLLMGGGNNVGSDPGASGVVITLPATLSINVSGALSVTGVLTVKSDGYLTSTNNTALSWITPVVEQLVDDYEVRLTSVSGSPPNSGSVLSTWLNLGSTKAWSWNVGAPQTSKTFTGTLEIRRVAVPSDIGSCTVSVSLTQG